ncbi:MAG: hypothetical protein L0271_24965 [Gemmatimonadetes bacterium]|nr:hypothetical protein [Gemmatimonadota bacterium]
MSAQSRTATVHEPSLRLIAIVTLIGVVLGAVLPWGSSAGDPRVSSASAAAASDPAAHDCQPSDRSAEVTARD